MPPCVAGSSSDKELGLAYEECAFNVIRDARYKYVHFTAMPPLFFDIQNHPEELYNLADDVTLSGLMLAYARKMLSWRMANDERTLTGMRVGLKGLACRRMGIICGERSHACPELS